MRLDRRAREQLAPSLEELTDRELEVLALMVEGLRREAIARRLGLSPNTVRTHTQNLHAKLGVRTDVAAVSVALEAGLRPGHRRTEEA